MSDSQGDAAAKAAAALRNARLLFAASTINTLSYGIYLVLAIMGIQLLLARKLEQRVSLIYSVIMLGLTTIWYILTTRSNEMVMVEKTHPGGKFDAYCSGSNVAAVALNTVQFFGSDLLLLYRAYTLWDRSLLYIALPLLTWLSSIGLGITGNLSCSPVVKPIEDITSVIVAYYSLTVATNALCTCLIIGKILWHQHQLRLSGISADDREYGFMSGLMAESGGWYAITGIINVVLIGINNDLSTVSEATFGALAYITQAQIILRIALGIDFKSSASARNRGEKTSTAMAFGSAFGGRSTHATGHTEKTEGEHSSGSDEWEHRSEGREKDAESGGVRIL